MKPPIVWADLPRSGLGNKLLVWAEAQVLAEQLGARCVTTGWSHWHIGAYLRGEYNKRSYAGQLRNDAASARAWAKLNRFRSESVESNQIPNIQASPGQWLRVHQVPHWADYFGRIRSQRAMIVTKLTRLLQPAILQELSEFPNCVGAIHVRMGDFKPLAAGVDFKTVGLTRTPFSYFVTLIETVREAAGQALPFMVFSDGHPEELSELLSVPGVTLAPRARDLVHILAMAKSRVLLCSAGSTFSQWATYLSDSAITLHHPDHFHAYVRPRDKQLPFEGVSSVEPTDWRPALRAHFANAQTYSKTM